MKRLRCCLCGRTIVPGLEMHTTIDGVSLPCHRDCGIPAAQAAPEEERHLVWIYSTKKKTRKQKKEERKHAEL